MRRDRHVRRALRQLASAATALATALAATGPVLAHGLFRDGDPADLVQDMLLNFALPLVVLGGGALVGVLLARWLARHDLPPAEADGAAVEGDEATTRT